MASVRLSSPASASSPFERWHRHFLENRDSAGAFPWHDSYRLTASEQRLVGRSIQQFQLGEWARGRGFMRRASSHPILASDSWFLPALKLSSPRNRDIAAFSDASSTASGFHG